MQKIRVIVASRRKVVRGGVAQIINSAPNLEVVGREGIDVLDEALKLQPDLVIYELSATDNTEYEIVRQLRESCGWTKLVIFSAASVSKESLRKFLQICNGYLQGPVLPGFFLKAVDLACYSGKFFFLGPSGDITVELEKELSQPLGDDSQKN